MDFWLTVHILKLYSNFRRFSKNSLPRICILCSLHTPEPIPICSACRLHLPFNHHPCRRCALPLPAQAPIDSLCGQCQNPMPSFDAVVAPFLYSEPVSNMINRFKHQGHLWAGAAITDMLAEQLLAREKPDCIVPIPLHWYRQFNRGFNQADWIARRLARQLDIPVDSALIKRTTATPPQQGLNRKQRLKNLRHAFQLNKSFSGSTIAIVDDVITTGSTLSTIATLLKLKGATKVYGWSLARTGLEKN